MKNMALCIFRQFLGAVVPYLVGAVVLTGGATSLELEQVLATRALGSLWYEEGVVQVRCSIAQVQLM